MSDDAVKSRTERDRQAFDDLQNEIAGHDTGRIKRFGIAAARDFEAKQEVKRNKAYRDALHRLLMTDPEYRELYEDLGSALGDAETTADTEIARLESQLSQIEADLDDMRSEAPKIDGKAIFRTANGRIMDEDGKELDGLIAEDIIWPSNAVSAENYVALRTQEADLRASLDAWHGYRNDMLGDLRNRFEDRDTPMSKDDMRDALRDIERAQPSVVAGAKNDDLPERPANALNQSAFPTIGD
ncbi:MAG: hypothetical protein AAFO77_15455 [Pseudomonadota bacterium]